MSVFDPQARVEWQLQGRHLSTAALCFKSVLLLSKFAESRFLLNAGVGKAGYGSDLTLITIPDRSGDFSPLYCHKMVKMRNFMLYAEPKGTDPGGISAGGHWSKGHVRVEQGHN